MIMVIGLFGFIVVKEVSLPSGVIAALGGLSLLGLLMTGIQYPEMPLYVLVAYLPFSRLLTGDFGTNAYALNMTNILIGWVIIGHSMKIVNSRHRVPMSSPMNFGVALFCFMGAISLVRTGFEYGGWYMSEIVTHFKRWFTPVFLYFLTLWVVREKRILKTVVILIMVAMVMVALMSIRDYMYVDDSSLEKARVGGIAEHSNTLGAFFVYYMFLFFGYFLTFSKKAKAWFLLIPFGLCFRGIMVTFSRGAYLGFAAGILAAFFYRSKIMFLAVLAVGAVIVANPIFLPAGIRYRMSQTAVERGPSSSLLAEGALEEGLEASASTRIKIWKGALKMIEEHPLWGVGYGAFPAFIPSYTEGAIGHMDAHNSYLLIAAEMGLPTLAVFLLVLLMALYYSWWLYRRTKDLDLKAIALGVLSGLCGLVVTNMFGSRMDDQAVSSYFWILCAIVIRGVLMERQEMRRLALERRKAKEVQEA